MRLVPASWQEPQFAFINVERWSYPLAFLPPAAVAWQAVQATPAATAGCGRLAMPVCSIDVVAGGCGMVNPPTEMYMGMAAAPSQLGLVAVPVPGQEGHGLQSGVPETAGDELCLKVVNVAPGFTVMWPLPQRPPVPFP